MLKSNTWLSWLNYISINPVLWIWPQVFIHIAIDVFIWQTSLKESPGMVNLGLTLVCRDVIVSLIHGLEKSNLFMRVTIVHLHVMNNSSIALRKGGYGQGRTGHRGYRENPWWADWVGMVQNTSPLPSPTGPPLTSPAPPTIFHVTQLEHV